jgi:hypothetical protein
MVEIEKDLRGQQKEAKTLAAEAKQESKSDK